MEKYSESLFLRKGVTAFCRCKISKKQMKPREKNYSLNKSKIKHALQTEFTDLLRTEASYGSNSIPKKIWYQSTVKDLKCTGTVVFIS